MRSRKSNWVHQFRKRRKALLIAAAGGKCINCGYNKCPAALDFHHRNPLDKLFEINGYRLQQKLETLLEEVKKCDLLCANCHREFHYIAEEEGIEPVLASRP